MTEVNNSLTAPFNPGSHDDMPDYSPIPAGEYLASCTQSEIKDTKTSGGKYIQLDFSISSDGFQGKKVIARINIQNSNPQVVINAQKELATLSRAMGVHTEFNNLNILHNKTLIINVAVRAATAQYGASNAIIGYKDAGLGGIQQTIPGMEETKETADTDADTPDWAVGQK